MRILAPVLAVLLLLAGCAARAGDTPLPSPSASSAPATDLVGGFWRVAADGETADTWLTMSDVGVTVFRPKGIVDGAWTARGSDLLVTTFGWSMTLGDDHDVPWLTGAASVEQDGDGYALVGQDGGRTAVLTRDGHPAASTQYVTDPATRDPSALATIGTAVPGSAATTLDPSAVEGTWRLRTARAVTLRLEDGTWSAHTTCASHTGANGGGGGYRLLAGGLLLVTSGPSTLIGCTETATIPPEGWRAIDFGAARSLSVGDGTLTVYDGTGAALGTLVR